MSAEFGKVIPFKSRFPQTVPSSRSFDGTAARKLEADNGYIINEHGFKLGRVAQIGAALRKGYSLPVDREATVDEIRHHTGSFLQITTPRGMISFNLAGDQSTIKAVIDAVNVRVSRVFDGPVEENQYGESKTDQISLHFKAKKGEIDLKKVLEAVVLGPVDVYDSLEGLKNQSEVQRFRWKTMFDESGAEGTGKGLLFLRMNQDEQMDNKIQAYQPDGSDYFVGGVKIVSPEEVAGVDMEGEWMTYTKLADHPKVDNSMRAKLFGEQAWIAGTKPEEMNISITISAHRTNYCCGNSVIAMLKKVVNGVKTGVELVSNGIEALKERGSQLFSRGVEKAYAYTSTGVSTSERSYCSKCNQERRRDEKCKCIQS